MKSLYHKHSYKLEAKVSLLVVAILWGSSFAFQKGLLEKIDPIIFTFYNFLVTGLLFLIYAIIKHRNLFFRLKEGIILGILIAGTEVTQMIGLHLSTAANTSFISNLGMLFIPFLGYLMYKHRITKFDFFSILLAGFGLYLLVGGIDGIKVGDIFLMVSAFCMAFYFLLSEVFESEKKSEMSVLCSQQFLVVAVLTGLYVIFSPLNFSLDKDVMNVFFWQIFIFTAFPYLLIQWSSKYSNEMTITMYDGIAEPLVGGLVAWVLFYEETTFTKVAGAMIMILAFGISVIYGRFKVEKKL